MDWWNKDFQYLLDRKILSRDELAYLFGQIKSIIDRENEQLRDENKRLTEFAEEQWLESGSHNCFTDWLEEALQGQKEEK